VLTPSPPRAAGSPGRAKHEKIQILHDRPGQTAPEEADLRATLAAIVGADLHVQRLRQLRDVIAMRLDQRPRAYRKQGEAAGEKPPPDEIHKRGRPPTFCARPDQTPDEWRAKVSERSSAL
jgi:hypothetical protein